VQPLRQTYLPVTPEWLKRSGLGCPPEELKLDVVRVPEGQHGVGGVGRFLDAGVANPEFAQPRSPGVEITALGDKKLQVIQPDGNSSNLP
jgi:hypothetical protein